MLWDWDRVSICYARSTMSYLLFLDESGHDHRTMPYEVRGGIALHARKLWPFVRRVQDAEQLAFGAALHTFGTEIKGSKLLDRKRFKLAAQLPPLDDATRRAAACAFLEKGRTGQAPTRTEFAAYGQASIKLAQLLFEALRDCDAAVLACAIPRGTTTAEVGTEGHLRKDHVFLFERFFYLLERENEPGLLVMDRSDDSADRRFVHRIERYFTRTSTGRYRTARIVPSPFFVASDMSYPVQVADVAVYCINWGFRLPTLGMDAPVREEIAAEFGPWLRRLQFEGDGHRDGHVFRSYGIVYVPTLGP